MILKNVGYLVTQNSEREILEGVDIEIENGRITRIEDEIPGEGTDYSDMAVLPGLVNAHTHSPMTLLRGISDDKSLNQWLEEDIFPVEDRLEEEDVYLGTLLAAYEMLASGTTCFNEMYFHIDGIARAVEDSGIRALLSYGMIDKDGDPVDELTSAAEIMGRYRERELVETGITPHSIYTCSEDLLIDSKKYAESRDSIYHIHVSETGEENSEAREKYGMNPVEYLYELGLMDSKTLIAHGTHLSQTDVEILSETEAGVVHNPSANLKLGSGIADVPELLEKGVNVCIGTDGPASNNSLNLFDEMGLAAILHKREDPGKINAQEVLDMATVNPANALGMEEEIGSVEEGKKADLLAIDMNRPGLNPVRDGEGLISNLVYSFNGEVSEVFVEGEKLVENGRHKSINLEELLRRANNRAAEIAD